VNLYNAGMRARKTQLYDGGHRVPCFVRWPAGKLRPAGEVDTPAQIQDLLPTVVELCGLKQPPDAKFDGTSLAGLLTGGAETLPDRTLVVQYGQIPRKWESAVLWNKWRLVNGKELYDLRTDPGQQNDVSAKHPDVLGRMRDYYEGWWAGVEPGLKDFCAVSIGTKHENPVLLCSADWEEVYADNPGHVSDVVGGPRGAPWNVAVETAGEYEIVLSRWPPHMALALTAGREPQKLTAGSLPAGKAMPIAGAKLQVAGISREVKTGPDDKAASFRVKLPVVQKTHLHGWFTDSEGKDLCGAFYATVRKV
jgi:arylsulfatase